MFWQSSPHSRDARCERWMRHGYALLCRQCYEEALAAFTQALACQAGARERPTGARLAAPSGSGPCGRPASAFSASPRGPRPGEARRSGPQAGYAPAWRAKAFTLVHLHRPLEALAAAEQAIALDPGDPLAYQSKSRALCALRRCAEALDAYEEAHRLAPEAIPALWEELFSA